MEKTEVIRRISATKRDCKIGAKALQNVFGALSALKIYQKNLESEITSVDQYFLNSSLFQYSIIRYAKPFINSKLDNKVAIYPISHINSFEGFNRNTHEHLMHLRHTLIAHDDFDEIMPKMLSLAAKFTLPDELVTFVTETQISNSSIANLVNPQQLAELLLHIEATVNAVKSKLDRDVVLDKDLCTDYHDIAIEVASYTKDFGLNTTGLPNPSPDIGNSEWLNLSVPNYSVHPNGYIYENFRYRCDFTSGNNIEIKSKSGEVVGIINQNKE